jgi:hypothetical protein
MKRTGREVAEVLAEIYRERFADDSHEQYRLGWADLRALAGVDKVNSEFIDEINEALEHENFALAPFDEFLALLQGEDCANLRMLSGRVLEAYLPESGEAAPEPDDEDQAID